MQQHCVFLDDVVAHSDNQARRLLRGRYHAHNGWASPHEAPGEVGAGDVKVELARLQGDLARLRLSMAQTR